MSYDLTFWKQNPTCSLPPVSIYRDLLDGKSVDGLEIIPTTEILVRIKRLFPNLAANGDSLCWDGEERGMLELDSSNQHVHFCCRELGDDDMNAIIDTLSEFNCPLYDPQVDTRFEP